MVSHSSHAINIYYYDPDLNYSTFLYRFHCIITLTLNYTDVHIITFNSRYIGFLSRFCADPQSKPWHDHFSVIRSQIFPDLKKNKKKTEQTVFYLKIETNYPFRGVVVWKQYGIIDLSWFSSPMIYSKYLNFFNISFIIYRSFRILSLLNAFGIKHCDVALGRKKQP